MFFRQPVSDSKPSVSDSKNSQNDQNLLLRYTEENAQLKQLLQHIAYGEKKLAERIIYSNPELLLLSGPVVKDYAGREIQQTAYQMALAAGDIFVKFDNEFSKFEAMKEMIERYFIKLLGEEKGIAKYKRQARMIFPDNFEKYLKENRAKDLAAVKEIFNVIGNAEANDEDELMDECGIALKKFKTHLEPKGIITTTTQGYHFDLQILVEAYGLYDANYEKFGNDSNSPKNLFAWQKVIGLIQRYITACDAMALCQGPDHIVDGEKLRRNLIFSHGRGVYFPLDSDMTWSLGTNCAVSDSRGWRGRASHLEEPPPRQLPPPPQWVFGPPVALLPGRIVAPAAPVPAAPVPAARIHRPRRGVIHTRSLEILCRSKTRSLCKLLQLPGYQSVSDSKNIPEDVNLRELDRKIVYVIAASLLLSSRGISDDIWLNHILPFLNFEFDLPASNVLTQVHRPLSLLFREHLREKGLQQLLQHIAYGEKGQAEEIIQCNPKLLLLSGPIVKDYAGRKIQQTAYQMALAAGDVVVKFKKQKYRPSAKDEEMKEMIERYFIKLLGKKNGVAEYKRQAKMIIPDNFEEYIKEKRAKDLAAVKEIFNAIGNAQAIDEAGLLGECETALKKFKTYLEPEGIITITTPGFHFHPQILVEAYRLLSPNFTNWGNTLDTTKWLFGLNKVIGLIQRYLTACDAMVLCQGLDDLIGYAFNDGEKFKRTLKLELRSGGGVFYFPLDSDLYWSIGKNCLVSSYGSLSGNDDKPLATAYYLEILYQAKTSSLRKLLQSQDNYSNIQCRSM